MPDELTLPYFVELTAADAKVIWIRADCLFQIQTREGDGARVLYYNHPRDTTTHHVDVLDSPKQILNQLNLAAKREPLA